MNSNGTPFWSGPKRAPDPLSFNIDDVSSRYTLWDKGADVTIQALDMEYLVAAANLHAYNYGLKGERDLAVFRKVIESMTIPEFKPKSGVKIQVNENEPVANNNDEGGSFSLPALCPMSSSG